MRVSEYAVPYAVSNAHYHEDNVYKMDGEDHTWANREDAHNALLRCEAAEELHGVLFQSMFCTAN